MANYGIRVSQKGYDVQEASDSQLLFSSSWPLLKIEKQGSFSTTDVTLPSTVYTHNLGYKPFFLILETSDGNSRTCGPEFDGGQFGVNSTELKFFGSYFRTGAKSFYYYIFRLPLTTNYTAPVVNQTNTSRNLIDNYGFKITKQGKSTSSTDMRDYILHSSCRSPMIHSVKYGDLIYNGSDYDLTSYPGLSYQPWFRCFYNQADVGGVDTSYMYPFWGGNGSTILLANSTSISIHSTVTTTGSIVVFKDPFTL